MAVTSVQAGRPAETGPGDGVCRRVNPTRPMHRSLPLVLVLLALAPLSGCETAQQVIASSGSALSPTTFSPGEVLHVFLTLNQGEVTTNEVAAGRATDNAVRTFSQEMAREHTAVVRRLEQLAQTENLTAAPNKLSTHLDNVARGHTDYMRTLSGRALDLHHVRTQIVMHQNALDLIDVTLTPNASNPALRSFLQSARPALVQHLDRARQLERALQ